VQGILTTTPAAFVIPSQSPVPVGFKPAAWPNSGTKPGSTSRLTSGLDGAADTEAIAADRAKAAVKNFMMVD